MSPVLSCAKVTPLFSFAQAGSDQTVCLPCAGSPDLHRINRAGHGRVPLPESTLQSKHELFQVNPMFLQKLRLAQKMVRIQILPMMPGAQRDRREVRGLLPQSFRSARALSGQSHVSAKTPARPEDGTNPDSPDDARSTAGSPRSPWSSAPILWDPRRSCAQPR